MFDLESIGTLDLSPLEVNEVEYEGLRLRFKEAVRLQPRLNDDNPQFVSVEDPGLGLDSFAGTVNDLFDEVAEDLVVVLCEGSRRGLVPESIGAETPAARRHG